MTHDLREKDIAVLQAIHDGASSVSEIQEQTTLSNREINYSLTEYSLEDLGLVEIQREKGREWKEINGEERYIWKPKTIQLTDKAITLLADLDTKNQYEDLSKRELIQRIEELEEQQKQIKSMLRDFREKVMDKI